MIYKTWFSFKGIVEIPSKYNWIRSFHKQWVGANGPSYLQTSTEFILWYPPPRQRRWVWSLDLFVQSFIQSVRSVLYNTLCLFPSVSAMLSERFLRHERTSWHYIFLEFFSLFSLINIVIIYYDIFNKTTHFVRAFKFCITIYN